MAVYVEQQFVIYFFYLPSFDGRRAFLAALFSSPTLALLLGQVSPPNRSQSQNRGRSGFPVHVLVEDVLAKTCSSLPAHLALYLSGPYVPAVAISRSVPTDCNRAEDAPMAKKEAAQP